MSIRKYGYLGLAVVLILMAFISTKYLVESTRLKSELNNFTQIIEQDRIKGLTLTIYYMHSDIRFRYLVNEDFIKSYPDYKIQVSGEDLLKHKGLLANLTVVDLHKVYRKSKYLDIRVHYVFSNDNGDNILNVSMNSLVDRMLVNGYEVKVNTAYFEVIMPFIRESSVQDLKRNLSRLKE